MTEIFLIAALLTALLALRPALKERSSARFCLAAFLSVIGILLPLFVFVTSAFMVPEWKGACPHGWLDCFHSGKLALTPLVLWASAALYALEIYRVKDRTRPWIVLGVSLGALVSSVCFIFGIMCINGLGPVLIVPLYVAVWYSIRANKLIRLARLPLSAYLWALLGSLPFWIWSVILSRRVFESLPDQAPRGCFVVTAAARGHETLVGPFVEITHHGRPHRANQQLHTLWQFEELWRARAPRSHAAFRHLYNRCGPVVAKRITSPWIADLTYLALKPVEIVARRLVKR